MTNIIGAIVFIVLLIFTTGLSIYFILKKEENSEKSKDILDHFKVECEDEDNEDELIEFSKLNKSKYKI